MTDDDIRKEVDRRMAAPSWIKTTAREAMLSFGRWVRDECDKHDKTKKVDMQQRM